jgi:ribosomal protein S18 acetylase RimI-like enzyme
MEEIVVRKAKIEDLQQLAQLIVRMKKLNEEFDPFFKVVPDAEKQALKYLSNSLNSENSVIFVSTNGKKILGIIRAEIEDRIFYEPSERGHITDFYILPEARRRALGNEMLLQISKELKRMGAEMITAEFPAQNEIAVRFYHKRGFRALTNIFAKMDERQ